MDPDSIYTSLHKEFPISKNDNKCIGPCYSAGTILTHPITKNTITSDFNFCPTIPKKIKTQYGEKILEYDECDYVLDATSKSIGIFEGKLNYKLFLKLFYNITSFYDAIKFIKTTNPNIYTEDRIINASWSAFGYDSDNIPNSVYEYYKEKIINNWQFSFIKKLQQNKKYTDENINKTIKKHIDKIKDFVIAYSKILSETTINNYGNNQKFIKKILLKSIYNTIESTN